MTRTHANETDTGGRAKAVLMGLALVLARVPFLWTRHIQEDAFITWRCAQSLVEHGTYGFNPGEWVSASTSHLYVFLSALAYRVLGDGFIVPLLLLNAAFFVAAVGLLVRRLGGGKDRWWLWALACLYAPGLLLSYTGMETALLFLLLALVVTSGGRPRPKAVGLVAMALLPWARPDWAAVGALVAVLAWPLEGRRSALWLSGALAVGVLSLLAFNQALFGFPLNQTVVAKSLDHHLGLNPLDWARHYLDPILWGAQGGMYSPVGTKYFHVGGILVYALLWASALGTWREDLRSKNAWLLASLYAVALALPVAYAVGNATFPWYFWASSFCAGFLILRMLLNRISSGRLPALAKPALALLLVALAGLQWMVSLNWGTQEYAYRASVGRYLKTVAAPQDSLLLEPAGYIPYFSGLYTYDEVGLVSKQTLDYRRRFGAPWYIHFIRDVQPTFLVQRGDWDQHKFYNGTEIDAEDQAWLAGHYTEIRRFVYKPEDFATNPLVLRVLHLGSANDYIVLKLNGPAPVDPARPKI